MSEIFNRLFLLRSVALEIFLLDGRSFFLSFADTKTRDAVYNKLVTKITSSGTGSSGEKITGIGADAGISSRLKQNFLGVSPLNDLTQKWCQREISNFEYLIRLNSWAGRSYNDLTQYPVFPWILKDYESEEVYRTHQ